MSRSLSSTLLRWNPQTEDFDREGQPLSVEHLQAWAELPYYHPMCPAAISREITWEDRQAMARFIEQSADETLTIQWARLQLRYAGFAFEARQWPLSLMGLAHAQWVDTYAIRRFLVTVQDQRFFELQDRQIVSPAEFQFLYGETAFENLTSHADQVRQHLKLVADQMRSPLITREVQVALEDGRIQTLRLQTLEVSGPDNWVLPAGAKVLDHSINSPTVSSTPENQ